SRSKSATITARARPLRRSPRTWAKRGSARTAAPETPSSSTHWMTSSACALAICAHTSRCAGRPWRSGPACASLLTRRSAIAFLLIGDSALATEASYHLLGVTGLQRATDLGLPLAVDAKHGSDGAPHLGFGAGVHLRSGSVRFLRVWHCCEPEQEPCRGGV